MALHPKYFNKMSPQGAHYICDKCLKKQGDLEVYTIASFIGSPCCLCGNTNGQHLKLTNASYEKVMKIK